MRSLHHLLLLHLLLLILAPGISASGDDAAPSTTALVTVQDSANFASPVGQSVKVMSVDGNPAPPTAVTSADPTSFGATVVTTATANENGTAQAASDDGYRIPPRGTRRTDVGSYLTAVVYGIIGLAYCFYGFYLFFPTLFLTGFFLVHNIVFLSLQRTRPFTVANGDEAKTRFTYFGIGTAAGVLGGVLLVVFWHIGVYIVGLVTGLAIAQAINSAIAIPWLALQIVLYCICGGICLVLVHYFERPVIIIGTALSGAYSAVLGVDVILNWGLTYDASLPNPQPSRESWIEIGIILVLAVVGMLWQFKRFNGRFGGDRRRKRDKTVVVQQNVYQQPYQPGLKIKS